MVGLGTNWKGVKGQVNEEQGRSESDQKHQCCVQHCVDDSED